MSNKNRPAVNLVQGANIPVETAEAQATDAANEKLEQHEKAVNAAIDTALKFVESTAQFHKWLEANPLVNKEAYQRAQEQAVKRATQEVDAEVSQLRAKLAELEAQKVKAAAAFGLPAQASTISTKGKRGRKPKGEISLPNESDILAAVKAMSPVSVDALATELNVTNTKNLAAKLKQLRAENKVDVMGQRRGMKYVSR